MIQTEPKKVHKSQQAQLLRWSRIREMRAREVTVYTIAVREGITPSAVYRILKVCIPWAEREGWL